MYNYSEILSLYKTIYKENNIPYSKDKLISELEYKGVSNFNAIKFIKQFNCYCQKRKRLKHRINEIIENRASIKNSDMYFITVTFTDNELSNTTSATRHDYIKRLCHDNFYRYIANIDFGKTTNREHYHILALCDNEIFYKEKNHLRIKSVKKLNGLIDIKKVPLDDDLNKIGEYTLKLSQHALKGEIDSQNCIIYDRNKSEDILMSGNTYFRILKNKENYKKQIEKNIHKNQEKYRTLRAQKRQMKFEDYVNYLFNSYIIDDGY